MDRWDRRSVGAVRWRKRIGIAVGVVAVAAAAFALGTLVGGGSSTSTQAVQAGFINRKHDLSWCPSRRARRLDLDVGGISCAHALDVIANFSGHVAISYPAGVRGYLFPDHRWTCWAKPDFKGHGGGVQNFCMQNGAGIVYFQRFTRAVR